MGAPDNTKEFCRVTSSGVTVYLHKSIRYREPVVIRLAGFLIFKHLVMDGWYSGLFAGAGTA
ncbi:hypothetical protein A6M21_16660 [Desulfotomaculum copahuensis]|uniref:Uncharacterized protein n=1 Tax=Desulfotomaculum copahuensis TaxID=1838280 RepID=A0A1B7LIH4_9FIRM|nr:hypothetical protein A6M21_16660 [Desulfotomaculum copahuensis]